MSEQSSPRRGVRPLGWCGAVWAAVLLVLLLAFVAPAARAQPATEPFAVRFRRGFVFDERLSALRQAADVTAPIKQRLRRGRGVYLLESRRDRGGVPFYRVAVTRRTRGWIQAAALAFPDRAGDDARVLALAETATDVERLSLCRLLIERFPRSPARPRALLMFGAEAEQVAGRLLRRADRRVGDEERLATAGVPRRYYYLNDVGLDRYNRLGARFEYDEAAGAYIYAGDSYRELIRRYPKTDAAAQARQRLARIEARLATNRKASVR